MKYFCPKCGKTTVYNLQLPKFCSNCGSHFGVGGKQPSETKPILPVENNREDAEVVNDEERLWSSMNFKTITPKFSINVYSHQGESFGSLLDNPSKPSPVANEAETIKRSSEEILSEFQREAGSSRGE